MKYAQSEGEGAKAVVVGLCAHGLAIVRALAAGGIDVIALENNRRLPGTRTNKARVIDVSDVNGPKLPAELLRFVRSEQFDEPPVLFLTNDRMVRQIGTAWSDLENDFRLSWGSSTANVIRYLDKRSIEERCETAGLLYPKTIILGAANGDLVDVSYPAIVKPVNPLGAFKALIAETDADIRQAADRYSASLPFLVQDWIQGPDQALYVCAMILQQEDVKARFDGRKLASFPPGTGQTSVMEYCRNDDVFELARSFFAGLGIEGPVSIEMKKSHHGKYYMIEPTVGRTDYFLDALTRNGVNFPVCEYNVAADQDSSFAEADDKAVWFDTERDRTCFLRTCRRLHKNGRLRRPVFPYLRIDDLRPFLVAVSKALPVILLSILRRVRNGKNPL